MLTIPASLPLEKRLLLESLVGSLSKVPHMQAIASFKILPFDYANNIQAALADAGYQPKY